MSTEYYSRGGSPAQRSGVRSTVMRAEFAAIERGFAKLPSFSGNAGKMVVVNGAGSALTVSALTLPSTPNTLASLEGAETLTNKRFTQRVAAIASALAITPAGDSTDQANHTNTEALGTLTINAPSGTPTELQILVLRIKSTNAHTITFNAIYRGSTDRPLPAALTGGGLTDYLCFRYNSADSKWDLVGMVKGF